MKKLWMILPVVLLVSACADMVPKKATQTVENSKVALSTESPPANCKRLELVTYSYFKGTFFSCDFDDAKNTMKNQALVLGGNYVKLIGINDAGVRCQGTGEAYACLEDKK